MSDTVFLPQQTVISSPWLNDVNATIYRLLGASAGPGGVAPANRNQILNNLGSGPVLPSVAAIRLLKKTDNSVAVVTGYYGPGDGGGGIYYLDPADVTSADNGGSIIVATDGGRWKLVVTMFLSIRQFGAKGDGVSDDAPAVRACLAALPYGGVMFIPVGLYLMNSSTNGAILDFTAFPNKPITMQGMGWTLKTGGSFTLGVGTGPQGSIFRMGTAISNTTDFFHQAMTDLVVGASQFKDFAIISNTGAYGTAFGRNGFNIDGTANVNGYMENLLMENVFIDNMASGSSILVNGVGNNQGVLAGAVFRRNKFMNALLPNFGDSNTFEYNTIGANAGVTGAVGISFYNVPGATNTRILNNNLVNFNGMILCNGATKPIIAGNECEQPAGFANSLGAMVVMQGNNGPVDTPTIVDNSLAQNSAVANYTPLVLNNCIGAKVSGNRLATPVSYNPIQIGNNSSYVVIEADNQFSVGGVAQDGLPVTDLGTKTMNRVSPWTTFTPTITASAGTFTTVTASGRFQLIDTRTMLIELDILITTVGTAAGSVVATIPSGFTGGAGIGAIAGREFAISGKGLGAHIPASGTTFTIAGGDGLSVIAAGAHLVLTGTFEIQ